MESQQFNFEKLEVWQLARVLAVDITKRTKEFPADEKFSMVSQMRRAALSVASNIAEGASRSSAKDQAHFSTVAYSSLMELLNQILIAADLGYLTIEEVDRYRKDILHLSVKLSNLRSSQLRRSGG